MRRLTAYGVTLFAVRLIKERLLSEEDTKFDPDDLQSVDEHYVGVLPE